MEDGESRFLGRIDANYDKLLKERKMAKIMIVLASIGVFAGVSAAFVFFFVYKLFQTPAFALLSAFIAIFAIYLHFQFLRDYWQIWTYQLKYWYIASMFMQIIFVLLFVVSVIIGIVYKESSTYFTSAVWIFMCWKWSFAIYYRSRRYRLMFTRYTLIDDANAEGEITSD